MIVWIAAPLALAIHERHLAAQGIRDVELLECALARPQQLYAYGKPAPDLADFAASLPFCLARNRKASVPFGSASASGWRKAEPYMTKAPITGVKA